MSQHRKATSALTVSAVPTMAVAYHFFEDFYRPGVAGSDCTDHTGSIESG